MSPKITLKGDPNPTPRKGKSFRASFGGTKCSVCWEEHEEGDEIRADGDGEWECAYHETEDAEEYEGAEEALP